MNKTFLFCHSSLLLGVKGYAWFECTFTLRTLDLRVDSCAGNIYSYRIACPVAYFFIWVFELSRAKGIVSRSFVLDIFQVALTPGVYKTFTITSVVFND